MGGLKWGPFGCLNWGPFKEQVKAIIQADLSQLSRVSWEQFKSIIQWLLDLNRPQFKSIIQGVPAIPDSQEWILGFNLNRPRYEDLQHLQHSQHVQALQH